MQRHRAASLTESGVHPGILATLTDRQIDDIYCHPRDDAGRLVAPAKPRGTRTLAEKLMEAEAAMQMFNIKREDREKVFQKIRDQHGAD